MGSLFFMPDGRTAQKTQRNKYVIVGKSGKIEYMLIFVTECISLLKKKQHDRMSCFVKRHRTRHIVRQVEQEL